MDIKTKVIEILNKEKYTFSQLADYLHMTEEGLTQELTNKTLELRNLEAISKALRVPLYSFFRAEDFKLSYSEKPHYMNMLWTGDDSTKTISQLTHEINLLKQMISLKEDQLKKLAS
jgi:transcriptional regulator with XRE-family HTH domain